MRIGILGGSFNPIHHGHLALASYATSELNLDKVLFVPTSRNPLKSKSQLLSAPLRAALVQKAIRRFPKFSLSRVELNKKGPAYTVDTLRAFKKRFGKKAQLYWLGGADNAKNFSRWKSPEEVLKLCRFALFTRPGSEWRTRDGRFLWVPMPPVDISSSQIRRQKSKPKKR